MSAPAPTSPSPSPSPPVPVYRGSSHTPDALPNHRVPSLCLHRYVPTPAFVTPEQTSDESIRPPLSACGLRPGVTWSEYYNDFIQLKQKYPTNSFKTFYFLRHAQGTHNEAESHFGTAVWDAVESLKEQYHDPDLTEKGKNQCASFAAVLPEALKQGMKPELIITSPLKRTLHTSSLCLKPLYSTLPVVSVELARETLGEHTCDRRSAVSEMSKRFNDVQFHFIADDVDPLWTTKRETDEEELIRAQRFLDFLFTLPEEHIILVNHSGMLTALANLFWKPFNPSEQSPIVALAGPPTPADVLQYLQKDGALSHPGISCRHCELQPFCVARLPTPTIQSTNDPNLLFFVPKSEPMLHTPAETVQFPLSSADQELIKKMIHSITPASLKKANAAWPSAAGMAASQWGFHKRIFLFCPNRDGVVTVMINPSYAPLSNERVQVTEGCFSVPGHRGTVSRWKRIRATYSDCDGKVHEKELSDWQARVFQHECDHTEGRLYDDAKANICTNFHAVGKRTVISPTDVTIIKRIGFVTSTVDPELTDDDRLAFPFLASHGIVVEPVVWETTTPSDISQLSGLVFRSCWNYHRKYDEFVQWLDLLAASNYHGRIANPLAVNKWNLDKGKYFGEMQAKGCPGMPKTVRLEAGTPVTQVLETVKAFQASTSSSTTTSSSTATTTPSAETHVILKPSISMAGHDTYCIPFNDLAMVEQKANEILHGLSRPLLIQEYFPQIKTHGEYSFIFFSGQFSHGVKKLPTAPGEFRIQSSYGGHHQSFQPSDHLIQAASKYLKFIPNSDSLLSVRVDTVLVGDDTSTNPHPLMLIEVEIIDPSLYLEFDGGAPQRFANAIADYFK